MGETDELPTLSRPYPKPMRCNDARNRKDYAPERPEDHGVYEVDEVAAYINVADAPFHEQPIALKRTTVGGWVRRGFFESERAHIFGRYRFIWFGDLITSRVIAMMLSFGVDARAIKQAHDWLAEDTNYDRPFIKRGIWTESPGIAHRLAEKVPGVFDAVTKRGRLPILEKLDRRLHEACRMDFDAETDLPVRWYPVDGVSMDPLMVSGNTCLPKRRMATRYVLGFSRSGDSVEDILSDHEITLEQFRTAVDWELGLEATGYRRPW